MKTLFLSPLQPQNAGGGWGGGRGGIPASFPPGPPFPKQPFQPTPPRPLVGRAPSPGGPGPKPPRDLAAWIPPLSPVDFLQAKFLTSCCVSNPWVRVSKRYHNPQSADLGGRWMVSEGGAVPRSRIPKMPRCSSAHEKPGLLHRLISCAQSLQPSLPFLLRRNNKVQGARS